MESTDLDMGEIYEEDGGEDKDFGAVGTLPDLPMATQAENEDENTEVLQRLKDLSKGAAKKVVRRPQPKLDPTRLTGERGIPILPKLLEKVKFKGKGHEAQDLSVIMRGLEHWSHRLFPKMPFDEVIERVEKLGSKKEVQTCIKKIRLDMPVLGDDVVGSDHDDDDNEGKETEDGPRREAELDELWVDLLREEDELRASHSQTDQTPRHKPGASQSISQPEQRPYQTPSIPATPVQKMTTDTPQGLTPEQLERMERNKQLARERKMRKIGIFSPVSVAKQSNASQSQPSPLSQHCPIVSAASDRSQSSQLSWQQSSQGFSGTKGNNQSNQCGSMETQPEQDIVNKSDKKVYNQTNQDVVDPGIEMSEVIKEGSCDNAKVTVLQSEASTDSRSSKLDVEMDVGFTVNNAEIDFEEASTAEKNIEEDDSNEMSAVIDNQDYHKNNTDSNEKHADKNVEDSVKMLAFIARQDINETSKLRPAQLK